MRIKLAIAAGAALAMIACGSPSTNPDTTDVRTPAKSTSPSKSAPTVAPSPSHPEPYITEESGNVVEDATDRGFITPGAYCASKLLGKQGKAGDGLTYTCKAPKPYRWRR